MTRPLTSAPGADDPDRSQPTDFEAIPAYIQLKAQQAELGRLAIPNPYLRTREGISSNTVVVEGRELVNYSGYNYLGLNGHAEVASAAKAAIDRYGTSVSASRFASGEIPLHAELERELADLIGTDDCVAFLSGYGTNVSTIGQLFDGRDLIVHDELIHNSARVGGVLSGAKRFAFPHNDVDALERILATHRSRFRRTLILIEGVYSMDGDIPDVPRIVAIKRRHRAMLMIDEAHSMGVLGARGRGIREHFDLDPTDVDIWMGTLSKAFAASGGYIAGSAALVEALKYTAGGFVYSVGLSPPDTAAALAAVRLLRREPERVARLRERTALFVRLAREAGLDTGASATAVVPVIVGASLLALRLADALFRRGILVHPIMYPAVRETGARLRFFVTASHTEQQIRSTIDHVADAMKELREPLASRVFASVAAAR